MNERTSKRTQAESARHLSNEHACEPRSVIVSAGCSFPLVGGGEPGRPVEREPSLLTEAIRRRLPKLGSTAGVKDPVVQVRFTAWRVCDWNAIEFDGDDVLFGLVWAVCPVWGYFRLSDLEGINRMYREPVIRADRLFEPEPASATLMGYVCDGTC